MPSTNLTPKQEAFCIAYAVEGKSQRQSYIAAYGQGNKTEKSIDELASRLMNNVKVMSRCEELKAQLAKEAVWEKADMIRDLRRIAEECRDAPIKVISKGNGSIESIDSKARSVAVNAIKTASEILGYKAPEKVDIGAQGGVTDIRISFVDKSNRNKRAEQDPKIVGEYTQGINTEDG